MKQVMFLLGFVLFAPRILALRTPARRENTMFFPIMALMYGPGMLTMSNVGVFFWLYYLSYTYLEKEMLSADWH